MFTSVDYGKRVSPAEEILDNTGKAIEDLARQVAEMKESGTEVGQCRAVRINSGKFGVEWQKTKAVLEAGELDITVVRPVMSGGVKGRGQVIGKKRILEAEMDGGDDGDVENATARPPMNLHPGIAKRRKRLGLDT